MGGPLAPFTASLEELKITAPSLDADSAAALASFFTNSEARLARLEVRTTEPITLAAVTVLAAGVRTNLFVSEIVLQAVSEADEAACIDEFALALASNTARSTALTNRAVRIPVTAATEDGAAPAAAFASVSLELRVVAGGRHRLLTVKPLSE
jgi:hypothetical protein